MLDLLDFFPAVIEGDDEPMPDPRSGEGAASADPLHVGRDDDHKTKAGEHIPDEPPDDHS